MATSGAMEKRPPVFTTIDKLRPDTSGHNLVVKVVDVKVVLTRQGGRPQQQARIAECLIGDQTGVIIFTARNEQVDIVHEGEYLILRNAKIDMYKGSMRLAVNQWGKVERTEKQNFEPKADHNLSLVEYELVRLDPGVEADTTAQQEAPAQSEPAAAE
ncbi:g7539 [Coccomyxa elongata]